MSEDAPDQPASRRTRWLVVIGASAAALCGIVWLDRRPVIRHFVDGTLARDHVRARYKLADVGLGRQRLTDVVIGDPAHPDLVADWIETQVGYGLTGPKLIGVRAGHVRLRGRLVDGRLSLGSVDRLLSAPGGGKTPISLPAIALSIADGRMWLETPAGVVGVALSGSGRLDGGFRGQLAATSGSLGDDGCAVATPRVTGTVALLAPDRGASRLRFVGPARWTTGRCGQVASDRGTATIDATVSSTTIAGRIGLSVDQLRIGDARAAHLGGRIALSGQPRTPIAMLDLVASSVRGGGFATESATASGRATLARRSFAGTVAWHGGSTSYAGIAADRLILPRGTPVSPLATAFADALRRAGRRSDGSAVIAAGPDGLTVKSVSATSASGMRLTFEGSAALPGETGHGRLGIDGGGMPMAMLDFRADPDGHADGSLHIGNYRAGDAVLEPAVLTLAASRSTWRLGGKVTLSGPIGTGHVEQLTVPIDAVARSGRISLFPDCTSIGATRLTLGGLTLNRPTATLCPTGAALVAIDHGRVGAAAHLMPLRLHGSLGTAPLAVAIGGGIADTRGARLEHVAATLGPVGRQSQLTFAQIDGAVADGGVAGAFADAGGAIGAVPLVLSKAGGNWRFADEILGVEGALTVADAANPASTCKPPFGADAPRFCPVEARDVRLTLADGRIEATGALYAPGTSVRLADVTVRHDLSAGSGNAGFVVPAIAFGTGFQPDRLVPATFGIVADVTGKVSAQAAIDWTGAGVTSTGRFTTTGIDLAAAFGPVTGISGTIVFDDLLALATPSGQVLKVAGINPGVPVNDGLVTYRLRPGSIVDVAGARWPFAGGTLTLEPTTLDLAHPVAKRLTFRVDGMQAAQFLQQFDFKNLDATGTFDGTLPMVFDDGGGRIENGRLTVRQGGGTIAYVGDLTEKDLGFWGNLAFQALKSLRYRSLDIQMNGPLAGEMVTGVRFAGVQQGKGAHANFLVRRLEKLPFVFNITIRAPFRGLIDSAQSFYDPRRLLGRLPVAGAPPVQPPASAPAP